MDYSLVKPLYECGYLTTLDDGPYVDSYYEYEYPEPTHTHRHYTGLDYDVLTVQP
jgi:hypothetical protein